MITLHVNTWEWITKRTFKTLNMGQRLNLKAIFGSLQHRLSTFSPSEFKTCLLQVETEIFHREDIVLLARPVFRVSLRADSVLKKIGAFVIY